MGTLINNKFLKLVALNITMVFISSLIAAEKSPSYVDGSKAFLEIQDVIR